MNENHPVVIELLSAGYTLEESVDAVERCEKFGHDMILDTDRTLDSALDYLTQLQRHLPHEDSQTLDNFNTEWLD